jgi:hypothetical protein
MALSWPPARNRKPAEVSKLSEEKVRENRLRRMLARRGFMLQKSRRRDPRAIDYGLYRIVDLEQNPVVAGSGRFERQMTLDDVEAWLKD